MKDLRQERKERTAPFMADRFGMFIHWGLYAIPSRCVWSISREPITPEKYMEYVREFNPVDYDPKKWAAAAKGAGMKYAVLCTKQHDGFCMFDSALTDYKCTNTPAKRDLVKEYADAYRAEGLKVGFYYSLLDWHHEDYPHYGEQTHPTRNDEKYKGMEHDFDRYVDYIHGQVRELLTNYGKIDVLWLDFSYGDKQGEKWRATELVKMIRQLQPEIVINNRLASFEPHEGSIFSENPTVYSGDFATPEQVIPPAGLRDALGEPIPWEACVSMNDNWGFVAADMNYKPAKMIIRKLVECVSKGGNMLLNVGPDAKGNIPKQSLEILSQIGQWMKDHKDSIYNCGPAEFAKPEWGWYTQNGNKLYAHLMEPSIGPYALSVPMEKIKKIRNLAYGSEILPIKPSNEEFFRDFSFVNIGTGGKVVCEIPNGIDMVLEIELNQD